MSEFTEPVSSVTWAPDGQTFITGGMDEYMISWDAQGERLYRASAPRTYDLEITADGSKIVTVCINDQLHVYDFHNWKNQRSYSLGSRLTGLETTKDSRYAIVNTAAREVILVDLENGRVIQRYSGQVQDQWVIRGCLGGANENFVLSGSEG